MGQHDDMAMNAGKQLSDVLQEAFDKDDRFNDTIREGFEAADAIQDFAKTVKAQGLPVRLAILQALRGAMNDVMAEDLSLDSPYQPGSQL